MRRIARRRHLIPPLLALLFAAGVGLGEPDTSSVPVGPEWSRTPLRINGIEVAVLGAADTLSALARVAEVTARLHELQADSARAASRFSVLRVKDRWLVVWDDVQVLEVTEADTTGGRDPRSLAEEWAGRLDRALLASAGSELRSRLFWKVALGLALPIVYVLLLRLAGLLSERTRRALRRTSGGREALRRGPLARLPAGTAVGWIDRFIGLLRVLVVALLSASFLLALLALFPQTERMSREAWQAVRRLLQAGGSTLLGWLPRLLIFVLLVIGLRIGFRFTDFLSASLSHRRGGEARLRRDQARIVNVIMKAALVFGAVLIFTVLLPPGEAMVMTLLILALVAVALVTLHEPLAALGQHLVFEFSGVCSPGDRVRVAGRQGVVLGIDAFGLRLLTRRGDVLFFPYRQVVSGLEVFPRGTWSWRWRLEVRAPRITGVEPEASRREPVHLAVRRGLRDAWGRLDREAVLRLVELRGSTRVYDLVLRSTRKRAVAFAREAWSGQEWPGAALLFDASRGEDDPSGVTPEDLGPSTSGAPRAGIDGQFRRDNDEAALCGEVLEETLLQALEQVGLKARLAIHD